MERSSENRDIAAETVSSNHIVFYNLIGASGVLQSHYIRDHFRVVVHELGHAFNLLHNGGPSGMIREKGLLRGDGSPDIGFEEKLGDKSTAYFGFAGPRDSWQFATGNNESELFADMFVGWVFGAFQWNRGDLLGERRWLYMQTIMSNNLSH